MGVRARVRVRRKVPPTRARSSRGSVQVRERESKKAPSIAQQNQKPKTKKQKTFFFSIFCFRSFAHTNTQHAPCVIITGGCTQVSDCYGLRCDVWVGILTYSYDFLQSIGCPCSCETQNPTNASDWTALAELYSSTGVASSWTEDSGWTNASSDPCTTPWFGVHCTAEGHVYMLLLAGNGLEGPVPSVWSEMTDALTELAYIDLQNNELTSTLDGFANMASLKLLELSTNYISGTLDSLAPLGDNLERLRVRNNLLTGTGDAFLAAMGTAFQEFCKLTPGRKRLKTYNMCCERMN